MRSTDDLSAWVRDARRRTLALVAGLDAGQLMGPRLPIVNPPLWEMGHVAWFQERWVLRHAAGRPPSRADADALWDSSAVGHDARWELALPSLAETVHYMAEVEAEVLRVLAGRPPADVRYFAEYGVYHEDMHDEAFAYTRQTLAYPPPPAPAPAAGAGPWPGDVAVPGGPFTIGAAEDEPFVFDNEKWAHTVTLAPFRIARAPVTASEFARFVEEGGYERREHWSDAGWLWRTREDARHPVYWRRTGQGWERRHFDRWVPLEPHRPVLHVGWFEAEAWCAWAGRRLPKEAEWERAASGPGGAGRRFPWGDAPPSAARANLDGAAGGCLDVAALPEGDSASGCRQMIGNVWEWTASDFRPYPGFVPDAYEDYSAPWFGTHKVLRGGCWATRARLLRTTWRNFYTPDRRDVWAGFRTCAR
ncbi:MAG TPA: selenoneine synthase SenA [Vicinamibacteria bacterium]|nr:selenoneine synthase SenA [Vicinamibacteria bacterium]